MSEQEKKDLIERVEAALDKVRPALERDGGNVELVEIGEDKVAYLKMLGHCGNCPMSQMTLRMGIERVLRNEVPEIQGVEAVSPD